jgi:hypothetical protein
MLGNRKPKSTLQIVTLPDGEKYQFMGATYGTHNVPPVLEAKVVSLLPRPLANLAQRHIGNSISQWNAGQEFDEPRLFVWFKHLGTNTPAPSMIPGPVAFLADEAGIELGAQDYPTFGGGAAWTYASFPIIPKRSQSLTCNIYWYRRAGSPSRPATITFSNPVYGHFPQWQPETLPAVKTAGDLQVRLDEVRSGQTASRNFNTSFLGSFSSARGTNETWTLHSAELSDAMGNVLRSTASLRAFSLGYPQATSAGQTPYYFSFDATLWPDEAAWRLKLEIQRSFGFAPEEVVTFKNVPVPAMGTTNFPALTKIVGGVKVELTFFERRPNIPVSSGEGFDDTWPNFAGRVRAELPGKPGGVALDFLEMKTDIGKATQLGSSFPDFGYEVLLRSIPTNATTMDFTFVLQKTRTVEFLVKPPKWN